MIMADHLDGSLDMTMIVVSFMSLIGVVVVAVLSFITNRHAKEGTKQATIGAEQATIGAEQSSQTNDAVNRKHEDEPRLFDMVVNLGIELEDHRLANKEQHEVLGEAIQKNWTALHSHVKWEEEVKYPTIEQIITPKETT